MESSDLLTIEQAAERISERMGVSLSVATMRVMRRTWPDGTCDGPTPLLVSRRRLRYRGKECDDYADQKLTAAQQAAERTTENEG